MACERSGEFGVWGTCDGDVLPSDEQCNGIDDDCDGAVDEGCSCEPGETKICGEDFGTVGPCQPGTQTCLEDGSWTPCEGAVGPAADVCDDGIDNDCDGEADEGCGCVPEQEVCDGVDNDCDRVVDEGCETQCDDPGPVEDPVVLCAWNPFPTRNVYMSPLVIDLDGDAKPEIVFSSVSGTPPYIAVNAIRGDDCSEVWTSELSVGVDDQAAAGDLDGDGRPELVFPHEGGHLVVLDADGNKLAESGAIAPPQPEPGVGGQNGGPIIVDIDGVAPPEIVFNAAVLRYEPGPPASLTILWDAGPVEGGTWGVVSIAADVDLDGAVEVLTGNRIFDGATGTDETPSALAALPGGYPALGQFEPGTPEPEIVLCSGHRNDGQIQVVDVTTGDTIFGPYMFPTKGATYYDGNGGTPTVVDVDCDGIPEIGVVTWNEYRMYDLDCAEEPLPSECEEAGVRWSIPLSISAGSNAGTAFDFASDGRPEIVYQDENELRVVNGATGDVIFSHALRGVSAFSLPPVADVDDDGHAEIVAIDWASNTHHGVVVLEGATDAWAPARPVWNQQPYHVTNVNDDGTIPSTEAPSWVGGIGYRQQR